VAKEGVEDLICKDLKNPFLGIDNSNIVLCVRPFVVVVTSWLTSVP